MKAVHPIIATVLLIAIAVITAGIVNIWISNFTDSTKDIKKEAEEQAGCMNAEISLENLNYCNNFLSGILYNEGMKGLGNLTLYVIYQNGTQQIVDLNTSLNAGYVVAFNITVNSNYNLVEILTNCTEKTAEAKRNKINTCE